MSYGNDDLNRIFDLLARMLDRFIKEQGGKNLKDLTLGDLLTMNPNTVLNERLTNIEQENQRIINHLDSFIGLLTYPDQLNDQIDQINNQIRELWNAVRTVELLKGVIELPKPNTGGEEKDELDFYTIVSTGESGMSQSTLAKLAGVSRQAIIKLQSTLVTKAPSVYLKPYINQDFTLVTKVEDNCIIDGKSVGNLTIYKSDFCAAVITHYAMRGNKIALHYLANYCAIGITKWIHGITGWNATATATN